MPVFLLVLLVVLLLWLFYESAPGAVYALAMAGERRWAGLRDRRVEVDDHIIACLDGGRGDPVLLLHGFGADRYHWPRFARHLTGSHRVVAPDLPGFGESSRLAGARYDVDAQVARLVALLDTLGIGAAHLVGNSMGGHLAAALLRQCPDRVRSLALFDAAGVDPRVDTEFIAALRRGENLLLADSREDFRRLTAMMFVRQPFIPGRVLDHLGAVAAARRAWNAAVFAQYWDAFDSLEHGPPLPVVPTLILWGREDRVLPVEDAESFRRLLPHAAIRILDGAGHLPMLERPDEVARCYLAFLRESAVSPASPIRPIR
jgi:pimeloyl-ACP methyl ester carboxylesterase